MRKSLIEVYLQKAADGDPEYIDKLCQQLADRLVYVPSVGDPEGKGKVGDSVKLFTIVEQHRRVIPLFTSLAKYKGWAASNGVNTNDKVSLFGADLCLSLGDRHWIVIDPGSSASVELQPVIVQRIATIETFGVGADQEEASQLRALPEDSPVIDLTQEIEAVPSASVVAAPLRHHAENGNQVGSGPPSNPAGSDAMLAYMSSGSSDAHRSSTDIPRPKKDLTSTEGLVAVAQAESSALEKKKKGSFLSFLKSGQDRG